MCANQITNCAALCKDQASVNTCDSDNDGQDNPFEDITYCFECTCADGSTPDLANYYDTIPTEVCERSRENCQYAYNQYGGSAPAGRCPTCGSQYAVEPTWMQLTPTPWSTTSAAAAVTSNAEAEVTTSSSSSEAVTDSTTWSPTSISTFTSTAKTNSTSSSTSFEGSSSPTTTVSLLTTVHTSTTTSAITRPRTSSTTSAAPVKSAGAAMIEPGMAAFGMGLAAVMVL